MKKKLTYEMFKAKMDYGSCICPFCGSNDVLPRFGDMNYNVEGDADVIFLK